MSDHRLLCVCDKAWCYCTNTVTTLDTPCFMCAEGAHAEPDGERWPDIAPSVKPGCFPTITVMVAVLAPLALMAVAAWLVVASAIWLVAKVIR